MSPQRAGADPQPLVVPAADLPGQISLRPSEISEPHGSRVGRVQPREHVDQPVGAALDVPLRVGV